MKRILSSIFITVLGIYVYGQDLPTRFEELTSPDYITAVNKSSKTCLLPIGVFEKHGPHLPLGTDLYIAREVALRAAALEYTVVFPWYYFSQINEAKHQPGTIAYSPELLWKILQETLDELSRNGFKKIIIVNGHGGNNAFLNYFGMAQLSEKRDYSLYVFQPVSDPDVLKKAEELTMHDGIDAHAGNGETSMMKAIQPNTVHTERATQQSGSDLERLQNLPYVYTGIWWYARFPNHYGGDGSKGNEKAGELLLESDVEQLVKSIKAIKDDRQVPELMERFYEELEQPLKTKQ